MEKACSFGCFLSLGTRRRTRLPQEPPSEFPCSSMLHHPPRPDSSYLLSQSLAKRKADACFDWTLLWIGGSLSALFACTYNCSSTTADREQLRWGATPMRCIRAYETRATAYTPSPSFPIKLNVHRSIYPLASGVPQRRAPRSCTVFVMTTPPMSTPVREGEKERKKENIQAKGGMGDGTPPPHRDFKERSVVLAVVVRLPLPLSLRSASPILAATFMPLLSINFTNTLRCIWPASLYYCRMAAALCRFRYAPSRYAPGGMLVVPPVVRVRTSEC